MDALARLIELDAVARLRAHDATLFGKADEDLALASKSLGWTRLAKGSADILEQVRKEESFGAAQWTKTREETDFTGAAKRWDVLELKGPQDFLCEVGGKKEREAKKEIPAVCEIWVSAEPRQDVCTILVWRVPDQAADKFPLAELAPLTARTLVVEAPQEAAAAEPAPQP